MDSAVAPLLDGDASRLAVLLDFDGSLSPIVDDPADAVALPDALDALRALVPHVGMLAIVSGRPVDFLRERVGIDGVRYVGQYGLEWIDEQGRRRHDPAADAYVDAVGRIADDAQRRFPDLLVERKGRLAVGLHWRTRNHLADEVARWAAEEAGRVGLAVHESRMARELRPPLPVDKGTAVRSLLDAATVDRACFAGDDRGDLAAFDAIAGLQAEGRLQAALRIGVRSSEAPAELLRTADLVVDGPPALAALLREMAEALS